MSLSPFLSFLYQCGAETEAGSDRSEAVCGDGLAQNKKKDSCSYTQLRSLSGEVQRLKLIRSNLAASGPFCR